MNVLLLAGGWSPEREVSLSGAREIQAALVALGHTVTLFDPEHSLQGLANAARGQDFAFLNLHGCPGEDGLPQAMLERLGLPYQGSSPAGSFLALDKAASKVICRKAGLTTPDWVHLVRKPNSDWQPPFPYPVFIKHNTGGSSLGLAKVCNAQEMQQAIDTLFANGGSYIVETACMGQEVTCGILSRLDSEKCDERGRIEIPEALPPILIRPKKSDALFDYASKYSQDGADELCPAPLPTDVNKRIQEAALKAHKALGLCGYSRSDFILQADGTLQLLEANTLPGMTRTSLVPREAKVIGMEFTDLIARLIEVGMERNRVAKA